MSKITLIFYENGRRVKTPFSKISDIFGRDDRPSEHAIKSLVEKFRSTGFVHNIPTPIRARPGRSTESMLTNYFWPIIDDIDVSNMWLQQDGATCHTARETLDLFQRKFTVQIITRNSAVNWPPRLCVLTPLDYTTVGNCAHGACDRYKKSLLTLNHDISVKKRDRVF